LVAPEAPELGCLFDVFEAGPLAKQALQGRVAGRVLKFLDDGPKPAMKSSAVCDAESPE
jgi:hypothetical protein